MGVIKNIPVMLAAFFTLIAGLHGYAGGLPNSQIYGNMCLFLVIFYIVGIFVRRTALSFVEANKEKAARLADENGGPLEIGAAEGVTAIDGAAEGGAGEVGVAAASAAATAAAGAGGAPDPGEGPGPEPGYGAETYLEPEASGAPAGGEEEAEFTGRAFRE